MPNIPGFHRRKGVGRSPGAYGNDIPKYSRMPGGYQPGQSHDSPSASDNDVRHWWDWFRRDTPSAIVVQCYRCKQEFVTKYTAVELARQCNDTYRLGMMIILCSPCGEVVSRSGKELRKLRDAFRQQTARKDVEPNDEY